MVEKNLLGLLQPCYKKGQGTHMALLGVLKETMRAVEDGKMTMIVLLDFTKAFDCIAHKLFLSKLRKLGIEEGPRCLGSNSN